MPADRDLILRVLSGLHSGAELPLVDGRYVLGKGDQCDVILSDDWIAEEHATLVVQGEQLTVESSGDSEVIVNGEVTKSGVVQLLQVITLGGTHLTIGAEDTAWHEIPLPSAEELTRARAASVEPQAEDGEAPATEQSDQQTNDESPNEPAQQNGEPPEPSQTEPGPSRRSVVPFVIAACILLLLLTVIGIGALSSSGVPETQPPTFAEIEKQLRELADTAGEDGQLEVIADEDNLSLVGYVQTDDDRRALEEKVDEFPMRVGFGVRSTARLASQAQQMLDRGKMEFQTSPGGPGEVIVSGDADNHDVWSEIEKTISRGVRRIANLKDNLTYPDTVVPDDTAQETSDEGQGTNVVYAPLPTARTTPGAPVLLPLNAANSGRNTASSLESTGDASTATQTPQGVTRKVPEYHLMVQSVSVGHSESIVVNDERILPGGVIHIGEVDSEGYIVKSIEFDEIYNAYQVTLVQNGRETIALVGAN